MQEQGDELRVATLRCAICHIARGSGPDKSELAWKARTNSDQWRRDDYISEIYLIGSALLAATAAANAATDYPTGYTKCAKEGETCSFSGTRSVAYGKSGTFVYATLTGPITCSGFSVPVDQRAQPALLLVWRYRLVELEQQQLDFEQQFELRAAAQLEQLVFEQQRRWQHHRRDLHIERQHVDHCDDSRDQRYV